MNDRKSQTWLDQEPSEYLSAPAGRPHEDLRVCAPDSRSLYVTFEDRGQVPLARLDVETLKLTSLVSEGTIDDVDVSRDGGFAVIAPNFHGSTGFGLKFQDSIKGQWGGAPYEDQMKAVDVALT